MSRSGTRDKADVDYTLEVGSYIIDRYVKDLWHKFDKENERLSNDELYNLRECLKVFATHKVAFEQAIIARTGASKAAIASDQEIKEQLMKEFGLDVDLGTQEENDDE